MERPATDVAEELAHAIETVLEDRLVALYLYGSAVTGGYDPGVSDIDLVAITTNPLGDRDLYDLDQMHIAFVEERSEWADRIEVVYIDQLALAEFRTSTARLAVISPGEPFHIRPEPPRAWTQNWYLLRETSRALRGPAASEIIPWIEWADFVEAARQYARELRDRIAAHASASSLAYEVLTTCRLVRNVREGVITTKRDAAAWARDAMPEWAWLIDEAVATRMTRGATGFESSRSRAAAVEFVRSLTELIGRPPTAKIT